MEKIQPVEHDEGYSTQERYEIQKEQHSIPE
jgi:hypothetical protein